MLNELDPIVEGRPQELYVEKEQEAIQDHAL